MFPRISKAKRKSGTYEYLVISESVRVKGKGSTTRNIANLGNIKRFSNKDVEGLIDGLIKIFKVEKYALSDQVEIVESLEHGSIILWRKLWNKMGLSQMVKSQLRQERTKVEIEAEKYIEMMVINRCVEALSKLGVTRWVPYAKDKRIKYKGQIMRRDRDGFGIDLFRKRSATNLKIIKIKDLFRIAKRGK